MKLKGDDVKVVSIALTPHEEPEEEVPEGAEQTENTAAEMPAEDASDDGAAAATAETAPDGGAEE